MKEGSDRIKYVWIYSSGIASLSFVWKRTKSNQKNQAHIFGQHMTGHTYQY